MPDILSIGECMIELFSEQPLEEADTFIRSLAGDSLNMIVAASRMGTTTGYITRVGSDPFTGYLLNTWRGENIDVSHVKVIDGFNAVHFVAQLPGGDREFVYYRKGSAPSTMVPEDLDPDFIASARILHLSGITQAISTTARAAVLKAAQIAKDKGVSVSYDPNYRHQLWTTQQARSAMEEVLPYVDYFLPSAPSDSVALFETDNPRDVISSARSLGIGVTSVTCGEMGAVVGYGDTVIELSPIASGPVIDTTGAGDAYNGGFLHAILNGMDIPEATMLGSIAAGLKLRGRGALTAMPTREEVYHLFGQLNR